MKERKVMKLASRGKRLGAYCIDMIIPATAFIIFSSAVSTLALRVPSMMDGGFGYYGYGYGYSYRGGSSAALIASVIIGIVLSITFLVIQIVLFTKSRTLGKALLGLQVVSSTDGEPIGFWKMLFREWFVKKASASVFLLGFIWVLIDDKNRGWHDKILDTYVIDMKESEKLNRRSSRTARPAAKPAAKPAARPSDPSVKKVRPAAALPEASKIVQEQSKPAATPVEEVKEVFSEAPVIETGDTDAAAAAAAPEIVPDKADPALKENVVEITEAVAVATEEALQSILKKDEDDPGEKEIEEVEETSGTQVSDDDLKSAGPADEHIEKVGPDE